MKVFCVRTQGYKTALEFDTKQDYVNFIDKLGDRLERIWVEVKDLEMGK